MTYDDEEDEDDDDKVEENNDDEEEDDDDRSIGLGWGRQVMGWFEREKLL